MSHPIPSIAVEHTWVQPLALPLLRPAPVALTTITTITTVRRAWSWFCPHQWLWLRLLLNLLLQLLLHLLRLLPLLLPQRL